MASREYAVDVAAYQPTSMSAYKHAGARQVIVKLTEGTDEQWVPAKFAKLI